MARPGAKTWAAIGLGGALVLGVGIAANAASHPAASVVQVASTASTTPTSTPKATPTSSVDVRTVVEDIAVPFASTTVEDPSRDAGTSAITTTGQNGVTSRTFRVIYVNGVESSRSLVSETVKQAPVDQVTSVGTRQPPPPPAAAPAPAPAPAAGGGCDPNYSGACVPIASDVDCAGGSGNGPAYVQGPVTVVGTDIYDLDRDGDGIGCE